MRKEADLEEIKFEKAHHSLHILEKRDEVVDSQPRIETEMALDLFDQLKKIKSKDMPVFKQNNDISLPFEEGSESEISEKALEQFEAEEDEYHKAEIKINEESPQLIKVTSSQNRRVDTEDLKEIQMKEALEIKIVE